MTIIFNSVYAIGRLWSKRIAWKMLSFSLTLLLFVWYSIAKRIFNIWNLLRLRKGLFHVDTVNNNIINLHEMINFASLQFVHVTDVSFALGLLYEKPPLNDWDWCLGTLTARYSWHQLSLTRKHRPLFIFHCLDFVHKSKSTKNELLEMGCIRTAQLSEGDAETTEHLSINKHNIYMHNIYKHM